jgi:hypothetical protein
MPEDEAADTPDWAGDLDAVDSWEDMRALLGRIYMKAGKPPVRVLADKTIDRRNCAVSKTTVGDILNGTKQQPKMHHLLGLAYALAVDERHLPLWRDVWCRLQSQEQPGPGDATKCESALRTALHEAGHELVRLWEELERYRTELCVRDGHGRAAHA